MSSRAVSCRLESDCGPDNVRNPVCARRVHWNLAKELVVTVVVPLVVRDDVTVEVTVEVAVLVTVVDGEVTSHDVNVPF